jgi:hypothetical protein
MSDSRLVVLGGVCADPDIATSSCQALVVTACDGEEQWQPLPPMHGKREMFVCVAVAVAKCIVVAGEYRHKSAEVHDEVLGRWLRLPCDLPLSDGTDWIGSMGSALL